MEQLEPLIGEWTLSARGEHFPQPEPGAPDAVARFEWMPGGKFVVERWEIPVPEAPDGLAVIGADPENDGRFLQHYFDLTYTRRSP